MNKTNYTIHIFIHHIIMSLHICSSDFIRRDRNVYFNTVTQLSEPIRTVSRNLYYGIKDNPMSLNTSSYQHEFKLQTKEKVKIVL